MEVYYSIVIALTIFAIVFLFAFVAAGPEGVVSYLKLKSHYILYTLAFWVPVVFAEHYIRFSPKEGSVNASEEARM